MKKKVLSLWFLVLLLLLASCVKGPNDKDIVILYTTDVHCGVEENIGYAGLSSYRNELEKDSYVALVDAGDYIQGDFIGVVSKGKYIIDIMNEMKYDVVTLGNHEFDYGIDNLSTLMKSFNGDVVSCNIKYNGKNENKLDMVKPYTIKKYGKYKIGFVGVSTPYSLTSSTPAYFMEDGKFVYSFTNDTKEEFYSCVQNNINSCKKAGADYVFLLSHLGYDENEDYSSNELVKNISGVKAVLDGHSHLDLNWKPVTDKDGNYVPICDAGYKLNEFGRILIRKDGLIEYDFVREYNEKDEAVADYVKKINDKNAELASALIASSDISLSISDADGVRMVRNRETAIGNLVADSYRAITGADIAAVNGGGIRANLKSGDITFKDIMAVHPFGNMVLMVEAKGQDILDYLEYSSRIVLKDYKENGRAIGESGGFANVSGLKYTIDTSIEPDIEIDSNNMFVKVNERRRVKDVYVLENNTYVPLDLNKTYKFASHNYLLQNGGDGASMFMNDKELPFSSKYDYEVLVEYIVDNLHGKLKEKYSNVEGRINVI